MQPFNYSIDVPNPTQGFLQGIQTADALKQRDIETQQKQIAFQQQQEMRQDLSALYSKPNPSTQDYIRIATRYPELGKNFKDLLGNLSEEQRQNKIGTMSQVLAALQSGSSDVAADLIKNTAEAQRNSGDEAGAKAADALAEVARTNPKVAINSVSTLLAASMGPEKFDSTFKTLFTAPQEAANAPVKNALENQNLVEDVESKRLKRQIDVIDAQIKSTDSETKRQELGLKRDELLAKQDEKSLKKKDEAAAAQGQLDAVAQQIETVKKIQDHPIAQGGLGGVGSVFKLGTANIPGTDAKDFENLVDSVKSQQFLSNLAALKASGGTLGQVTEAEGMRMEKAIASLDTNQSPEAFKAATNTIKKSLEKIQQQIIASGNLPKNSAGGKGGENLGKTFLFNSPKYGKVTDAMVNQALEDNPGLTREQAIQFFSGK